MYEIMRQTKITEAICRQADGSRTDGKKGYQLPFPVMRFDVNFPAADHSEVTSDTDSFTRLFLTTIRFPSTENHPTFCPGDQEIKEDIEHIDLSKEDEYVHGVKGLADFLNCGTSKAQAIINSKILEKKLNQGFNNMLVDGSFIKRDFPNS